MVPNKSGAESDLLHCRRCQGLMCVIELRDSDGSRGTYCADALRCILCGEIVDAVIAGNRRRGLTVGERPRLVRTRQVTPAIAV